MTTWRVSSGLPRQFMLMNEKRRCSILFHLLVAGGKWQTRISRPVWSARRWSSVFHSRVRLPLEPPHGDHVGVIVAESEVEALELSAETGDGLCHRIASTATALAADAFDALGRV